MTIPAAPRVELDPLALSWHSEIWSAAFRLMNPENVEGGCSYLSVPVHGAGNCPMVPKLSLKYVGGECRTLGLYVHPNNCTKNDLKLVVSLKVYGSDHLICNSTKSFAKSFGPGNDCWWGYDKFFDLDILKQNAKNFHSTHHCASGFTVRGRITIRVVSENNWRFNHADIVKNPRKYLFLQGEGSSDLMTIPEPVEMISLHEKMLSMLVDINGVGRAVGLQGIVTFRVGQDRVDFRAHINIVNSTLPVPLFHTQTVEGRSSIVVLEHLKPDTFYVMLKYIYTHDVSDDDLSTHAIDLIVMAEQYLLTDLRFKCEYFLCWQVQASPVTLQTIIPVLTTADANSFESLKNACLEAVFLHGQHLFNDPLMAEIPQKIAVDMLVYFANRRCVSETMSHLDDASSMKQ